VTAQEYGNIGPAVAVLGDSEHALDQFIIRGIE
jgi:hypothetical protein